MLRCNLDVSVMQSCLAHALSTEREEIMGLLLGNIDRENAVANIKRSLILSRRDKQPDRVEIAFEDLSMASTIAEEITAYAHEEQKIIGWYHSHPHITVLPSSVDVQTQGQYQALDDGFIGLIFSVFDKGRFDICAFQSVNNNMAWMRKEIPINILHETPYRTYESLISLQVSIIREERSMFEHFIQNDPNQVGSALDVYTSSMRTILDNQILPLNHALLSRKQSLLNEKTRLIAEIRALEGDNNGLETSYIPPDRPAFAPILETMLRAFPIWVEEYRCIQLALKGFEASRVIIRRGEELVHINENRLLVKIEAAPVQLSTMSKGRRLPPWCTHLGGVAYYITSSNISSAQSFNLEAICVTAEDDFPTDGVVEIQLADTVNVAAQISALGHFNSAFHLIRVV